LIKLYKNMVFICIALLIFIMSDLSILKNYLASIYAEKRAHRASIIPQTSHLLTTNSTTIFTFVGMGEEEQWCGQPARIGGRVGT
jgi:hypothetical protein